MVSPGFELVHHDAQVMHILQHTVCNSIALTTRPLADTPKYSSIYEYVHHADALMHIVLQIGKVN